MKLTLMYKLVDGTWHCWGMYKNFRATLVFSGDSIVHAYIKFAWHQTTYGWQAIDRLDNSQDYSPENCRWITHSENSRNEDV